MEVRLGPADQIPEGECRGFEHGTQYVLVARFAGELFAIDDVCNHAGCLLSGGWIEKQAIVCPCHEYTFDIPSGRNVTVPRLAEDQPVFPLRIDAGEIVVTLPDGKR